MHPVTAGVAGKGQASTLEASYWILLDSGQAMDMKLNFQLLYSILEALPVGVFIKTLSDDFKITYWSQGAEKIFLIPRETVLNKNAYHFWPKDQADLYFAADKKVLEEKSRLIFHANPASAAMAAKSGSTR